MGEERTEDGPEAGAARPEPMPEPTLEDLLDNTPEAVAMRRARAARAEAAAREARSPAGPRRSTRRQWLVGAALGGLLAARALERAVRR